MKLGIVGSGKIVQEFLPWLVQAPTVEVAALCSTERSAEKAAALCRQYGVPLHVTDYGRLLEAVDTVYIALPNLLHTAYAKAALEAGRNAIVEKPLAPCAAEAARLAALARSKGLYLFEAVTTQYLPNYRKLQGLLPRVGPVKVVQCSFCQYSSRYDAFLAGQTAPVFDPNQAGGALMDLGVYNVSYIVACLGNPSRCTMPPTSKRASIPAASSPWITAPSRRSALPPRTAPHPPAI